jgi:hypothetical protein
LARLLTTRPWRTLLVRVDQFTVAIVAVLFRLPAKQIVFELTLLGLQALDLFLELPLQLSLLRRQLLDGSLELADAPDGSAMPALPVARLLPQFQVGTL